MRLQEYNQLHGAESFTKSWHLFDLSRNTSRFTEPEVSVQRPRDPATCPYPEPDQSNPSSPASCL